MVRQSSVFLIIAIIALLYLIPGPIVATWSLSVVPGWHTTIFPPYLIGSIFQLLWIWLLPLLYFFVEKKRLVIKKYVFPLHLICTLTYFLSAGSIDILLNTVATLVWTIIVNVLFIVGQVFFLRAVITAKAQ